jgi:hypothetical protein
LCCADIHAGHASITAIDITFPIFILLFIFIEDNACRTGYVTDASLAAACLYDYFTTIKLPGAYFVA